MYVKWEPFHHHYIVFVVTLLHISNVIVITQVRTARTVISQLSCVSHCLLAKAVFRIIISHIGSG